MGTEHRDALYTIQHYAQQALYAHQKEVQELRAELSAAKAFGERMAADKLELTKQRDKLAERVIELETALRNGPPHSIVDGVLDMLEKAVKA